MDTKLATVEQVNTQQIGMKAEMYRDKERAELKRQLCACLGIDLDQLEALVRSPQRIRMLEDKCATLEAAGSSCKCDSLEARFMKRCDALWWVTYRACCPGNMLFSPLTLDQLSDNAQVEIDQIVTGLGGDYVDAFPVPPGKKIRLVQRRRPGYLPNKIEVDVSLANNGNNYLDLRVQFYLTSSEAEQGERIGPNYAGNQFLNKDGTQIHKPFPEYRSAPLAIGSLELVAVEITHTGQSNALDSASVRLPYDEKFWAKMCTDAGLCIPPQPC